MLIVGRIKIGKIDFFQRKDKLVRVAPVYVNVTVVCAEYGEFKVDVAGNAAQRVPVFTAEFLTILAVNNINYLWTTRIG